MVSSEEERDEKPVYTIGVAARILDISVYTLRMYERNGLFVSHRTESGQRLYSETDLERLRCIRNGIRREKVSIEGIRRMFSLIPCWAIVRCSEEDRKNCPAYNGDGAPCWSLKTKAQFCKTKDCRSCEVYREFSDCRSIKSRMKRLLST